ncbi:SCP-like protein [Ancylostoma caninum]|uniref:SCP-like protein n=1 Tax=Ancylostoma caninum TaxID=29170 RepID=A0A368GZN2_ANCCA|nr:SCP-like protein [Ancylostoma caninum]
MTVVRDCPSDPDLTHVPADKSVNYAIRRHVENALGSDQAYADEMEVVIAEWVNYRFDANLDINTVIYDDEIMKPYANIIYNETLAIGCTIMWCSSKRLAAACVYSDKPKLGEPLYDPGKKGAKCSGKSCEKVIEGAKCINANDLEGLCGTDMKQSPTKPTTSSTTTTTTKSTSRTRPKRTKSTTKTTTSPTTKRTKSTKTTTKSTATTTKKNSEVMTQAVRDRIISMHNSYRSTLARGLVRNGKEGNPNCPTAMNMYRMRYDMTLESEAQTYADSCPTAESLLSTRPYSGENIEIIPGTSTPYLKAIESALQEWWTQILRNGVNNKMQYTEYLENKPNAPTKFTQMAWANTYTVGCGLQRCSHGTVVVCRYKPRGNVYTHYIYRPGQMCGSCTGSCSEGLCPTPAN